MTTPPEEAGQGEDDAEDTGAYAQFTNVELKSWALRLGFIGIALILALWITAIAMNLLDSEAGHGLANLTAVWLLTVGTVAVLLGVFLQLASLRVAKLRGEALKAAEVQAATDSGLGAIAKALADILKSARVPVAAMLVGAILMVTGGIVAIESVDDDIGEDEFAEMELQHLLEQRERELFGELRGFEELMGEICRRLESSDVAPRRLGDFGELLLEMCG